MRTGWTLARIARPQHWTALLILVLAACNGDPVTVQVDETPVVLAFDVPGRFYRGDSVGALVRFTVEDPQGAGDLVSATLNVQRPGTSHALEIPMRDDGVNGDIIAADGQFVAELKGSVWPNAGQAQISATVSDRAGNSASTDPASAEVLEGPPAGIPEVAAVSFPAKVSNNPDAMTTLAVVVTDPDGFADIGPVTYEIYPPSFSRPATTGTLPMIPGLRDSLAATYGKALTGSEIGTREGQYTIRIIAMDVSGLRSRARIHIFSVTALVPVIQSITAPDTVDSESDDEVQLLATMQDEDRDLTEVSYSITPAAATEPLLAGAMRDDGVVDDGTANNFVFGVRIPSMDFQNLATFYTLRIDAKDAAGGRASPVEKLLVILPIANPNSPVITRVSVPDTLQRPQSGTRIVLLQAQVTDPNGLADIQRVFFNSFLPSGAASSGNPFLMRDDGQENDPAAGDGEYSLTIQLNSGAPLGDFRFVFEAVDMAGNRSEQVERILTVVQ